MTEDEMVGCYHQLDGHEFEQASGVDDAQGSLACCSPWSHKESDKTERLDWTEQESTGWAKDGSWMFELINKAWNTIFIWNPFFFQFRQLNQLKFDYSVFWLIVKVLSSFLFFLWKGAPAAPAGRWQRKCWHCHLLLSDGTYLPVLVRLWILPAELVGSL